MLVVENLVRRYGDLTAVDGVSFRIAPGETYGLLGPNGAGKTTTISMVVGSAMDNDSAAARRARRLRRRAPPRRGVAAAPQPRPSDLTGPAYRLSSPPPTQARIAAMSCGLGSIRAPRHSPMTLSAQVSATFFAVGLAVRSSPA